MTAQPTTADCGHEHPRGECQRFEWCVVHDEPRSRDMWTCAGWTYPRRGKPDKCQFIWLPKPVHADLPERTPGLWAQ